MTESTPARRRARRRTVLAAIGLCVVACVAATTALAMLVFGAPRDCCALPPPFPSGGDEELSVDPWSAFFEEADADVVAVELVRPDSYGVIHVRATVQNNTAEDRDYDVTVAVTSPDGTHRYAKETVELDEVEAAGTASGSAVLDVTDLPTDAVVSLVSATRTK